MLMNLDPGSLAIVGAAVLVVAFIFGSICDAVMGDDGFGPVGNMLLFFAGFVVSIMAAKAYGIHFHDTARTIGTGFGGALGGIAILALLKASFRRIL
jgi:H+/gluconate symporter-like permease